MGFFSSLLSQTWKPDSSKEELDVFEKAEIYTNIQNLHKVAQDLLEKGYNDQGVYLSTKMMFLEKNSDDPKNVPYTKWLVGMDSKIRNVGYPFTYWDIATHINYKNLSFWDNAINVDRIRVDIKIDSKPNVSGDLSLYWHSTKLQASFGVPELPESMKLELLHCQENMALRVRAIDFQKKTPKRLDLSAAIYASCLKLGGEASYAVESRRFMRSWVGCAMKTNDFMASIIYWRDLDSLVGSFVHHFGEEFDWGIEMTKLISSNQYTATFGVAWKHDDDGIISNYVSKAKINHLGVLNGCIETKLGLDYVASVSGQMDLKHPLECPKVGFKLLFKSSAIQTYDVMKKKSIKTFSNLL